MSRFARTWGRALCLIVTLSLASSLTLSACRKAPLSPEAPGVTGTATPAPGALAPNVTVPEVTEPAEVVAPDGAKGAEGTTGKTDGGLNPAFKKPVTPIFVGGCREACREPISAFRAFLKAAREDPDGGAIIAHLNTAELVVNGEALGKGWAALWVAKRWPEREASVRAFTKAFLAWVRNLPDPPEFDATIRDGVKVVADESERALLMWRHPRLDESAALSAPEWRFVLEPRGLEWLIVEIDQHSGKGPQRGTGKEEP